MNTMRIFVAFLVAVLACTQLGAAACTDLYTCPPDHAFQESAGRCVCCSTSGTTCVDAVNKCTDPEGCSVCTAAGACTECTPPYQLEGERCVVAECTVEHCKECQTPDRTKCAVCNAGFRPVNGVCQRDGDASVQPVAALVALAVVAGVALFSAV